MNGVRPALLFVVFCAAINSRDGEQVAFSPRLGVFLLIRENEEANLISCHCAPLFARAVSWGIGCKAAVYIHFATKLACNGWRAAELLTNWDLEILVPWSRPVPRMRVKCGKKMRVFFCSHMSNNRKKCTHLFEFWRNMGDQLYAWKALLYKRNLCD